jgi:L-cysteine:1D-myo-inositol 2-amino-2-deoxy-alpha-D-glucopyranoside ligase
VKSWSAPRLPSLPDRGPIPRIFDSASGELRPAEATDGVAALYVCGITPYDATHLGHAATYLAFDTLVRVWRDAGYEVRYAQNVTDVDDPLLERAATIGVDWRELAASQVELFRGDMQSLSIIPPEHYIAVTDVIDEVATSVRALVDAGIAYPVESADAAPDLYFDITAAQAAAPWRLGDESRLDRAEMLQLFSERGGDPDREGKRDALDPLLWRAERDGEPSWESSVGTGRPGWHIECTAIALRHLPSPLTVNGGGSDLLFPHHEFSAGHGTALTGNPYADIHAHAGMVAYQGEKMSKSLGNLVLVSQLVRDGVDPRIIRLAILSEHYRSDWEWTDASLDAARATLAAWLDWAASLTTAGDETLLTRIRDHLSHDLDARLAIRAVNEFVASGVAASSTDLDAIHALLGIDLRA